MSDAGDDAPVTDRALQGALRTTYQMLARQRLDLERVERTVEALMAAVVEANLVPEDAIDAQLADADRAVRERRRPEATVLLDDTADKRAVDGPPIDCASLLHLCLGRCCKLDVALSAQDLDEGKLRWRYERPYVLRQDRDGYCAHIDRGSLGCTVYADRPAMCRKFDCRNDKRIWIDFAAQVPAPIERVAPQVIELRLPPRKPR